MLLPSYTLETYTRAHREMRLAEAARERLVMSIPPTRNVDTVARAALSLWSRRSATMRRARA